MQVTSLLLHEYKVELRTSVNNNDTYKCRGLLSQCFGVCSITYAITNHRLADQNTSIKNL